MSVLVTGGAGYIGGFVCRRLVDAGLHVEILDNLTTGHFKNVEGMHFTEGNIGDAKLIRSICFDYNVDTVIHLAGVRHLPSQVFSDCISFDRSPDYDFEDNYFDTVRLSMAAYDCGIDRFIFASSIEENATKRQCETFVRTRFPNTVTLRLGEVAGADDKFGDDRLHLNNGHWGARFLPEMLNKLIYGGTIKIPSFPEDENGLLFDYVHVLDVAEAFYRAWEYLDGGGTHLTCDIGSGNPISAHDVFDIVTKNYYALQPGQVVQSDIGFQWSVSGKAADLGTSRYRLGWLPTHDLYNIILTSYRHEVRRGKAT